MEKPYPELRGNHRDVLTVDFVRDVQPMCYAEFGVHKGHTAVEVAKVLPAGARLFLFDYQDKADAVAKAIRALEPSVEVVVKGNSGKLRDSYCWPLIRMLESDDDRIFDYVYIDGAHMFDADALCFLLVDRLLKPSGYVDFDDYRWRACGSRTMRPSRFPLMNKLYTDEQLKERHIRLIINTLVRRDPTYREVVRRKIFQKMGV